jgi:hypothetical protein
VSPTSIVAKTALLSNRPAVQDDVTAYELDISPFIFKEEFAKALDAVQNSPVEERTIPRALEKQVRLQVKNFSLNGGILLCFFIFFLTLDLYFYIIFEVCACSYTGPKSTRSSTFIKCGRYYARIAYCFSI